MTIVATISCYTLSAQVLKATNRELLDEMVAPVLSESARGVLSTDNEVVSLGSISDTECHDISFAIRNTTATKVAITELRSSCSCLKLKSRALTLEGGEQTTIGATFNPAGRNDSFSLNIDLYTSLDSSRPTMRLIITGEVIRSDQWAHLAESMGALRLSRRSVTIEGRGSERIAIANSGTTALRLTASPQIEGLRLRTEPEVIEPQCEGDMVIEYRGEPIELNTAIVVDGISGSATQRMIKITIRR